MILYKKIFFPTFLILSLVLFLTSCSSDSVSKSKELIQKATGNQLTVLSHFKAEPNLYGFVVQTQNSQEGIVYTTRNGKYFFSGQIYDSKGQNLTKSQFSTYVEPAAAKNAYNKVDKTSYIQQGKNNALHKIYAVVDPNCLYCHDFFEAVQPYIKSGKLAVRWIVVGMLKPSSQYKAYAILASENPLSAMKENEKNFNRNKESGGIAENESPSGSTKREYQKNMNFLKVAHITGTPTIIYQTQGGIKQIQQGMPSIKMEKFIQFAGNAW